MFQPLKTWKFTAWRANFGKRCTGLRNDCRKIEKFGLASQIRRAAVSLTNNIAEGHGRYHYLDQIKFTLHSRGSLEELLDDLNVCEDEQYVPVDEIAPLREDGWRVRQLIDGYVRYLRQQSADRRGSSVREDSPAYDEDDRRFTIHDVTIHGENSSFQNLARECEWRRVSGLHNGCFRGNGRAGRSQSHSGDASERPRLPLELQSRQVRLVFGRDQRDAKVDVHDPPERSVP